MCNLYTASADALPGVRDVRVAGDRIEAGERLLDHPQGKFGVRRVKRRTV